MKLTGAAIVAETLIEQGTSTVFGYPGGQVINLYDALYERSDRIHHVITAHEQGASHAADGYARATGKVGVVIATSGPGATNLVTGIATAYLDSIPLVAITGNVSNALIGRDSFQEVDIVGVTMPVTKHNFLVKKIEDLAPTIREAFKIAKSGRPGPVLVDIPKDVQTASFEFEPQGVIAASPSPAADSELIKEAVKLINESERPYIYCGGGVVTSNASEEVQTLAEKIDAPFGCTMMGVAIAPKTNKRFLGMEGMHGQYASSMAQNDADLIIACGARFSDRATGNVSKYAKKAKIIHIDVDAAELDKNVLSTLSIQSDVKYALDKIINLVSENKHAQWNEEIQKFKEIEETKSYRFDEYKEKLNGLMTPYEAIDALKEAAGSETVVATDVGQHQMWTAQRYSFDHARDFISSGGLGTMGFGMGAAIGAYFGTGKQVALVTGDGSFGMNLNELATAVSNNVPLVVLILNNGVLGMVRQWQTLFFDKHYSQTTLNRKTDFVKLAESFGAKGFSATNLDELKRVLKEAFALKSPAVIDCAINEDEFVLPMLPPGGSIDDMIIK
jgi:acetolactate synthase-1/2/3 large subunit